MKVLVVGGAGYIGGAVTDALLTGGVPFTVYDNLTYESHYFKSVDFTYGDIRDRAKLKKLLPKYSHVIWLAALVGDPACAINSELTREINQESVGWLAENFSGRIVFTSTCSVYGIQDTPVVEESPTNPISVYAQTKLGAERVLRKKNAMILRLGTAFGISDSYSRLRMDLAVNYMTMNAVKKKKLTVFGGSQWRPFIHVRDIGGVIVDNLNKKTAGIYNVATINETISRLGKKIQKATGCVIEVTKQGFQDQRNYNAITEKALRDGVIPLSTTNDIEFGIQQIKKVVEENRVNNLESEFYSNERRMLAVMEQYLNWTPTTSKHA